MDSHGPAAEPLSYPRAPARSVLTPGVRLTESTTKTPAESMLLALPQQLCRGNIRNVYWKAWTRELIHGSKSMKSTDVSTNVVGNWLISGW